MKAYVIVSGNTAQIHFLWHDNDFLDRLKHLYSGRGEDILLSNDPSENDGYVQHILSPIIVAHMNIRKELGEECQLIRCSKVGCDVIFQEHSELLYIGFCDQSENTFDEMERTLFVLHGLIKFFFGPCQQNIKPSRLNKKNRVWKNISNALISYTTLYRNEQSFLVECVSQLHVNVSVQNMSSNILEHCTKNLAGMFPREKLAAGFLCVGAKFLAHHLSSKASNISSSDLLRMLILAHSKYDEEEEVDFLHVDASSAAEVCEWLEEEDEHNDGSDNLELSPRVDIPISQVFTTDNAEGGISEEATFSFEPRIDSFDKVANMDRMIAVGSEEQVGSSLDESRDEFVWKESRKIRVSQSMKNFNPPQRNRVHRHYSEKQRNPRNQIDEVPGRDLSEFKTKFKGIVMCPVFLNTPSSRHTPFMMRAVEITDHLKFIVLTEMKEKVIASLISNFLWLLRKIKFVDGQVHSDNPRRTSCHVQVEGNQKTIDDLSFCCKQLRSKLNVKDDNMCQIIIRLWEQKIVKQLQKMIKLPNPGEDARLDQNITQLKKNLQLLFQRFFLRQHNRSENDWQHQLSFMKVYIKEKLNDYLGYLTVKSYRNIALRWDHEQYPGMLHFIYVERSRTAPRTGAVGSSSAESQNVFKDKIASSSLYVPPSTTDAEEEIVNLLKHQVWRGVSLAYTCFRQDGCTKMYAKSGDFKFTSYLWFESDDGHPIEIPHNPDGCIKTSNSTETIPGVLAGQFYRDFLGKQFKMNSEANVPRSFNVFELHVVHFSVMPGATVGQQCERLFIELRQSSLLSRGSTPSPQKSAVANSPNVFKFDNPLM